MALVTALLISTSKIHQYFANPSQIAPQHAEFSKNLSSIKYTITKLEVDSEDKKENVFYLINVDYISEFEETLSLGHSDRGSIYPAQDIIITLTFTIGLSWLLVDSDMG